MPRTLLLSALIVAATGLAAVAAEPASASASASASGGRVFEMRTYVANPGKFEALQSRFRDHTCAIFKKHGMENVGYWVPQDEKDGKGGTLVYLIAFPSRDAAQKSWAAFRADPEWQKVAAESEKDGKLVKEVKSVFLDPTDYSPIK